MSVKGYKDLWDCGENSTMTFWDHLDVSSTKTKLNRIWLSAVITLWWSLQHIKPSPSSWKGVTSYHNSPMTSSTSHISNNNLPNILDKQLYNTCVLMFCWISGSNGVRDMIRMFARIQHASLIKTTIIQVAISCDSRLLFISACPIQAKQLSLWIEDCLERQALKCQ